MNGKKLIGDISGNVDLNRINMGKIKRIEVLDGAASSLYGSDAIGGVINIITDQPTDQLISVTSNSRVSGKGQWSQSANVDIFTKGFGSYTSFSHDAADSYQNSNLTTDSKTGETLETIDPLFVGYTSNVVNQRFTYDFRKGQKYYEGELKGVFNFYDGATTMIGADWRKDYLVATAGDVDNNAYTWAGYAQHDMKLLQNLSATVGVRYTRHEAFGNNFTPKVALMYSPGNFRFRAAYSQGFRAPGLDELYYHYFKLMAGRPVITFGNKNLNAEKSNYVSLNAEYSNRVFSISVMGYMNFINDMIIKEKHTVDDATRAELRQEFPEMTEAQAAKLKSYSLYVNSDKGSVKGLQVNASVNVFDGFSVMGSYIYTYARTKTGDEWKDLERSVRHTGTLAFNYNQTWNRYTLNVNLNGRLQSKTLYPNYEDAPGYGVWGINTTHTFNVSKWLNVMPSVGVENIFNKKDDRIDHDNIRHALYSPGRMFVVGLKLNFKG